PQDTRLESRRRTSRRGQSSVPPTCPKARRIGVLLLRLTMRRAVEWAMAAARELPFEQRLPVTLGVIQRNELQHFHFCEGEAARINLAAADIPHSAARRVAVIRQVADREAALLNKLPGARLRDA